VEAYVSNAHSPLTDLHALEAIRLIYPNLAACLRDPGDVALRAPVMLGSLEAGLAFSNASLGAVHALAHSLGGYLDLPHGECNAILLRQVMEFNMPAAGDQFSLILKAMGFESRRLTPREMTASILAEIERLRRAVGIHQTLHDLGVHRTDVRQLAESAERDPCLATNPRAANRRDLEVLYEESL
jgi:alcohol dehydrogenase class IV